MASKYTAMLWLPAEVAKNLPIVKEVEPVVEWDAEARTFTDEQVQKDGKKVWRTQALLGMGWNGDLEPVEIRLLSDSKPTVPMNLEALAQFMGQASTATNVATRQPVSSGSVAPQRRA